MRQKVILIASLALLLGVSAVAQESRSEIGLQGTGFFTKDTSGQGTTDRTTNTGGFLLSLSLQPHPLARGRSGLRL